MGKTLIRLHLSLLLLLFVSSGICQESLSPEAESYHIYVVQQAWHTGIIIRTKEIDAGVWPEVSKYTHKTYVDISWGDEKFYQVSGRPWLLAARAILWPTQSVIKVFPFSNSVRSSYGNQARIIKIPLSEEQFTALTQFISDSFQRDREEQVISSNIFGETRLFFLATRKYHLFRTCNTWVALALKEAGFDIRSCCVINASQLFRQLEKIHGAGYME